MRTKCAPKRSKSASVRRSHDGAGPPGSSATHLVRVVWLYPGAPAPDPVLVISLVASSLSLNLMVPAVLAACLMVLAIAADRVPLGCRRHRRGFAAGAARHDPGSRREAGPHRRTERRVAGVVRQVVPSPRPDEHHSQLDRVSEREPDRGGRRKRGESSQSKEARSKGRPNALLPWQAVRRRSWIWGWRPAPERAKTQTEPKADR